MLSGENANPFLFFTEPPVCAVRSSLVIKVLTVERATIDLVKVAGRKSLSLVVQGRLRGILRNE